MKNRQRRTQRLITVFAALTVLPLLHCAPRNALVSSANRAAGLEQQIHREVQEKRRARRLPPLARNELLDKEAKQHSRRMADGRVGFSHIGSHRRAERLRAALPLATVAENIARNRGFEDPVRPAIDGWMASKGHRRNLLGDYDFTGVGVVVADDGTVFVTQLFGKISRESRRP